MQCFTSIKIPIIILSYGKMSRDIKVEVESKICLESRLNRPVYMIKVFVGKATCRKAKLVQFFRFIANTKI